MSTISKTFETFKTWNLEKITNEIIKEVHEHHPTDSLQDKADLLGVSYYTLVKKTKALGLDHLIKFLDKDGKQKLFSLLDESPLNTNIVIKNYKPTTLANYVCEYVRNHEKNLGYAVSEIESGVCVYLYERKTPKNIKKVK